MRAGCREDMTAKATPRQASWECWGTSPATVRIPSGMSYQLYYLVTDFITRPQLDALEFGLGTGEHSYVDGLIQAGSRCGKVQTVLSRFRPLDRGNPCCRIGKEAAVLVN